MHGASCHKHNTMKLTLSFPVGALGDIAVGELYKELYASITSIVKEEEVVGIQLYPAQWPRKVLISVHDEAVKEALLITGIDVRGFHVDLRDESEQFTKITIKDAMMSWPDQRLIDLLSPYGKVVKIEKEMVYINGRETKWTTGTRFAYLCPLETVIPPRLMVFDEELQKQVAVTIWYRRPQSDGEKCRKCGGPHDVTTCMFSNKVCYICYGDHERRKCPKNDGSRFNDEVICFLTEKSPLSNFNMEFPVEIDGQAYSCNEQYIQSQKAKLFADQKAYDDIMTSQDARDMKRKGRHIRNYNDALWKESSLQIIETCVRAKVSQNVAVKKYLLGTGDKMIGEGSPDPFWGVGIHISDPKVLDINQWTGANVMGKTLMDVRSELKIMNEFLNELNEYTEGIMKGKNESKMEEDDEEDSPFHDVSETPDGLPCVLLLGDSNVSGMEAKFKHLGVHVEVVSKAGATLQDAEAMLQTCNMSTESVNGVLIHLGTCNWQVDGDTNVDTGISVYNEYVEALNACTDKFPFAHLFTSSIVRRLPVDERALQINDAVQDVNKCLGELSKSEDNVSFIDTDVILLNDQTVCHKLYTQCDKIGAELNETGRNLMADVFAHVLEGFFSSL